MDNYRKCGKCKNTILGPKGIVDKKSFWKWSVKGGHPDKGGNEDIFKDVSACNDMFESGVCNWSTNYRYDASPPRRSSPPRRPAASRAPPRARSPPRARPPRSRGRKPCRPDQYRNPETGRCKKKPSDARAPAGTRRRKPCKEGEYRHPETGRCRKIRRPNSSRPPRERSPRTGLKPCKAGYERNMETRRCRKIRRSRRSRRRTRSRSRRRSRKYSRRY
jgi:hypothetical protein